jgi:hypothetical protein
MPDTRFAARFSGNPRAAQVLMRTFARFFAI